MKFKRTCPLVKLHYTQMHSLSESRRCGCRQHKGHCRTTKLWCGVCQASQFKSSIVHAEVVHA